VAGIVSRRPITGVAAGVIIGALGLLLLGIEAPPASGLSISALLFKVAGNFFLFVAAVAFLGAFLAVRSRRSASGGGPDKRERKTDA
jgi:hypothetical protein